MSGTIPVTALLEILAAKDAEIKKLMKEKDELAEKLRRYELAEENNARPGGQSEKLPNRNFADVWSAINELKRRQDEPEVQIIEDPDPAPSAKRNRPDLTHAAIDELKDKIDSVQNEARTAITNLRKQYADINNQLEITKTPVNTAKPGFTILLIGGKKNTKEFAGPLVLSSDRSKWIEVELNLPYTFSGSGVVYLNEEIYLIGGWKNFNSAYKLDKNLKWIRLADMNYGRFGITTSCVTRNGYIWVFGGPQGRNNKARSIERYNPKKNKWTIMQDMKYPYKEVPTIVWKDKIVLGGRDPDRAGLEQTSTPEMFNPKDGSWTKLPNLLKHRARCMVSYKEKIIIMGGCDFNDRSTPVWELDPHKPNPTWSALPPINIPRWGLRGAVLDGKIYAIGGIQLQGRHLNRVEVFDGINWRDGPSLPYPMANMAAVIIPQDLADRLCAQKS